MSLGAREIRTWVALLSSGGILHGERETSGALAAIEVVGEDRLSELREWLGSQPPEAVQRVRGAAIELCIWMAVADRVIDPAERDAIADIIETAGLDAETETRLLGTLTAALGDVRRVHHVETLAESLDHPVLRELMLALTWHMAAADGFVDVLEGASHDRLAAIFGVDPAVAARIRHKLDASG